MRYAVKVLVTTFQNVSMIEQKLLYYFAEGAELNHFFKASREPLLGYCLKILLKTMNS